MDCSLYGLVVYSISVWLDLELFWKTQTDPSRTGDTKAGTFIGTDRYGNKYFENMAEELPRKLASNIRLGCFWGWLMRLFSPDTMGRLQTG